MTDTVSPTTEQHTAVADTPGHPGGDGLVKPGYDDRLANSDLAPLRKQTWSSYNIVAFWMSDVHSVGGYVTAGALFSLGIASWQVLVSLVVGIGIVMVFCNLVAKPSQVTGVPYPVINRAVFGVRGANIPAIIRGCIAIAWYGVQTYLAATSLMIIFLKFLPGFATGLDGVSFLGLSGLDYLCYAILWVAQAMVFWRGMEAIRRFIDFAGPAVYVVMIALCVYLVAKAGIGNISLNLSTQQMSFGASIPVMLAAIAAVVSYFSGPMLNFGDFSRYARSFRAVRTGNWLGLPLNFLFFSILTVVTASATVPVFGELITDPIATVERIDSAFAILLGGLTFVIATVGINIVANFISPAFDFSNVNPRRISWRMGGMIAAVGSVLLTPWNWYNSDEGILFTLGILGALIGPLFGILIAGYYLISKQRVWVDDMYTMSPAGRYWFRNGYNPNAVAAVLIGGVPAIALVLVGGVVWADSASAILSHAGDFSWFVGCGLGFLSFWALERHNPRILGLDAERELCHDGVGGDHATGVGRGRTAAADRRGQPEHDAADDRPDGRLRRAAARPRHRAAGPDERDRSGLHREPPGRGPRRPRAGPGRGGRGGRGGGRLRGGLLRRPGLDACREVATGPVVGIAEAAMHVATLLGRSFSIVTTLARTMGQAEHLVQRYGYAAKCRSIYACEVPVLELDDPGSEARKLVVDHCRRAVEHDEADSIVLGCAGMADFCADVSEQVGVPVVDGVTAGVLLVESMVKLGLRTSTRSEYAAPLPKVYA